MGDGIRARNGVPVVGEGVKGDTIVVNISRQVGPISSDDLDQEDELHNVAVLHLYISRAVKPLLVSISKHAKWVKKAEWGLDAALITKGVKVRGGLKAEAEPASR